MLQLSDIVYQIVFDISETMTNLDIVSLRSDVTLSKTPVTDCKRVAIRDIFSRDDHHHHHQQLNNVPLFGYRFS
jgi:hypothetical protein